MIFQLTTEAERQAVKDYIDRLPNGRAYTAEVKLHRQPRTVSQNRLYWMWLNCISDETGDDAETLHEYFVDTFLGAESRTCFDTEVKRRKSTTKLTTEQFTHYLDMVERFASAELGMLLPHPDDAFFEQFNDKYGKR